ncbi:Cadherin EGF LAG seven-pass G-type receptor 2 [Desmophyllum pertusum]|uniref:Cadherin EGF LAG seven-pass G-type receptor 2 n=1 Tax=Desmophyllum pertusum TaxID=174260 RepID=A0A9W9YDK8_9CNID|nr:Cadherin EGF LAG seven-pass G-type receptor 2 [Desmophyllum pertusum]
MTTSVKLDREQASFYRLVITAKDHGTPSLSSTVVVSVTVLDENDNKPAFSLPFYQASVLENTAIQTNILRVVATDPDDGLNGLVTFSIVSGNTKDAFAIDNSTGFLSVNQNLDREDVAFYSLYIKASDNAPNPTWSSVRVNFTVLDENDNSPAFVNVANFTVVENSKSGTSVGTVYAIDADAGNKRSSSVFHC